MKNKVKTAVKPTDAATPRPWSDGVTAKTWPEGIIVFTHRPDREPIHSGYLELTQWFRPDWVDGDIASANRRKERILYMRFDSIVRAVNLLEAHEALEALIQRGILNARNDRIITARMNMDSTPEESQWEIDAKAALAQLAKLKKEME